MFEKYYQYIKTLFKKYGNGWRNEEIEETKNNIIFHYDNKYYVLSIVEKEGENIDDEDEYNEKSKIIRFL